MAAMGDIADSYIMEFADVIPRKRRGVWQPLLYMAACLILAIGIAAVFPTIANRRTDPKDPTDRPKDNVSSGVAGDSDAPLHFYLDGKAFIMAPEITIVTEVPKGYR